MSVGGGGFNRQAPVFREHALQHGFQMLTLQPNDLAEHRSRDLLVDIGAPPPTQSTPGDVRLVTFAIVETSC